MLSGLAGKCSYERFNLQKGRVERMAQGYKEHRGGVEEVTGIDKNGIEVVRRE